MYKRADIKTGFLCNNNCRFCVQAHKKSHGNRSKDEIFRDLEGARESGCTGVVFTGGEVSIRDDFFDLLRQARTLGFEVIQVQTNGRRFSYMDFCEKAVEAGMNEFAPAVHGHSAEMHDFLTRAEGSYDQTLRGIENIRKLGLPIITNTVVVKPNYRYLPQMARMFVHLGVDQFQFAFVHAVGNARLYFEEMVPEASKAAEYIRKGLLIGADAGLIVMAEAVPYCLMQGCEKFVSELYIPMGDIYDVDHVYRDWEKLRKEQGKTKFAGCKSCRFDTVCEGPWKEYPARFGDAEFVAVPGEKVRAKEDIIGGE